MPKWGRVYTINCNYQVVAFGKNMSLTCVYDRCPPPALLCRNLAALTRRCSCTVLYYNYSPLVIILVGKRSVNVGLLHALLPDIRQKLESVRGIVGIA